MSGRSSSYLIGQPSDRRKLIAVVYADMVGYSRLLGMDDAGPLERLRTLTGGDYLLIAFDSVEGAVRYAVPVQQRIPIQSAN
jgi:hypothetical protein